MGFSKPRLSLNGGHSVSFAHAFLNYALAEAMALIDAKPTPPDVLRQIPAIRFQLQSHRRALLAILGMGQLKSLPTCLRRQCPKFKRSSSAASPIS
jgi:hypothetical protein